MLFLEARDIEMKAKQSGKISSVQSCGSVSIEHFMSYKGIRVPEFSSSGEKIAIMWNNKSFHHPPEFLPTLGPPK